MKFKWLRHIWEVFMKILWVFFSGRIPIKLTWRRPITKTPKALNISLRWWFGGIWMLFGILFLLFALYALKSNSEFLPSAKHARGEIVEILASSRDNKPTPLISFYDEKGVERFFNPSEGVNIVREGDAVDLLYIQEDPELTRFYFSSIFDRTVLILLSVAIFSIGLGMGSLILMKN